MGAELAGRAVSERYANFGTFRHVGSLAADETKGTGRAAIARLLERASNGDARAFRKADVIRRRLGLAWTDLFDHRRAA